MDTATLARYASAFLATAPGAYLPLLADMLARHEGSVAGVLDELTPIFLGGFSPLATEQTLVNALVDRLIGTGVTNDQRMYALDWVAGQRAGGASWGQVAHDAIVTLDGITEGPWLDAAQHMRAQVDRGMAATEGWAAGVTDLGALQAIYNGALAYDAGTFVLDPSPSIAVDLAALGVSAEATHLSYKVRYDYGETATLLNQPQSLLTAKLEIEGADAGARNSTRSDLSGARLESVTLVANISDWHISVTPLLRTLDLSGVQGDAHVVLATPDRPVNYGNVNISLPVGVLDLQWQIQGRTTDRVVFDRDTLAAGSSITLDYADGAASSLPVYTLAFDAGQATSRVAVGGVKAFAAYFKGAAAPGQPIGEISMRAGQTVQVKLDAAANLDVHVQQGASGILTIIDGHKAGGSTIDWVSTEILNALAVPGQGWNEAAVAGGRLLWVDVNGNGALDRLTTGGIKDFVLIETSGSELPALNISLTGLGLPTVGDLFS